MYLPYLGLGRFKLGLFECARSGARAFVSLLGRYDARARYLRSHASLAMGSAASGQLATLARVPASP